MLLCLTMHLQPTSRPGHLTPVYGTYRTAVLYAVFAMHPSYLATRHAGGGHDNRLLPGGRPNNPVERFLAGLDPPKVQPGEVRLPWTILIRRIRSLQHRTITIDSYAPRSRTTSPSYRSFDK